MTQKSLWIILEKVAVKRWINYFECLNPTIKTGSIRYNNMKVHKAARLNHDSEGLNQLGQWKSLVLMLYMGHTMWKLCGISR